MPPLARAKERVAVALGSPAGASESRQTMLCAYLSAALLAGLGLNALLGWWWADPVTALLLAGVAGREARAAWRGDACCTAMPAPQLGSSAVPPCCSTAAAGSARARSVSRMPTS